MTFLPSATPSRAQRRPMPLAHPPTLLVGSGLCTDLGRIVSLDSPAALLLGWDAKCAGRQDLPDLLPDAVPETPWPLQGGFHLEANVQRPPCAGQEWSETAWVRITIHALPHSTGGATHMMLVEDITCQRDYEDRLRHQAHYDPLTGLPNRLLALDRIEQAQAAATRKQCHVSVMVVEVEHLDRITHALGCDTADQVLLEFADRLCNAVRGNDTVAHMEGGVFLIILGELPQAGIAECIARRIQDSGSKPFELKDHEIILSVRIGLASYPHDGQNAAGLIRKAHSAAARADGGSGYCFFTPRMDEESQRRFRIESLLLRAIERHELQVHFQPLIGGRCGRILGAEALVRWTSPELGMVPPDQFIPVAEANGQILVLSDWIFEQACRQALPWIGKDPDFRLALNFSPRQFEQPNLVRHLTDMLDRIGFPTRGVEVEVTERLVMGDVQTTRTMLEELKQCGVSLSLDDFGTGYSALSYLKRYPFDTIKIDRAFVADVEHSEEDRHVVTAIVSMAHGLRKGVIAEGVENEEQARFLRGLGCELMQGYHFSRPLSAAAFDQLFQSQFLPERIAS